MALPLYESVEEVVRAIEIEGPGPDLHQSIMARHREEWPTLWTALDSLLNNYHEEDTPVGVVGGDPNLGTEPGPISRFFRNLFN